MLVAGTQMKVSMETKEENIQKAEKFIYLAAEQGAKVICLQEFFTTGLFTKTIDKAYLSWSEPISGPTITRMQNLARELKVWLLVPIYERSERITGVNYNSVVVIDPEGNVVTKASKRYVPLSAFAERYYFRPGSLDSQVFEVNGLKCGIVICYERHFFEISRLEVLKGAEVLFITNATYTAPGRSSIWEHELISIAANNSVYVVAVNSTGEADGCHQFGRSMIIDPMGNVIKQLGQEEDIILADLQKDNVLKAREINLYLRDLRKDILLEILRLMP